MPVVLEGGHDVLRRGEHQLRHRLPEGVHDVRDEPNLPGGFKSGDIKLNFTFT